jgi:hypothetical protein
MATPRIPRTLPSGKPKPDVRRRVRHLAFIRQLPCVACGKAAPSEAAHVHTGTDSGVGIKPGDRYAVPLCSACHARQHRIGELTFWSALRIDPLNVALRLWTVSSDIAAGKRIVFRAANRSIFGRHIANRRIDLQKSFSLQALMVPTPAVRASDLPQIEWPML